MSSTLNNFLAEADVAQLPENEAFVGIDVDDLVKNLEELRKMIEADKFSKEQLRTLLKIFEEIYNLLNPFESMCPELKPLLEKLKVCKEKEKKLNKKQLNYRITILNFVKQSRLFYFKAIK